MRRLFLLLVFTAILPISCTSLLSLDEDVIDVVEEVFVEKGIDFPWAESEGMRNALRRASQLATIEWRPINDVPWNKGFFHAGCVQTGIPYSSTKQINKYVGLDVSFHTFMTAVSNPYSVLYKENISQPPYSGVNCATYYGDVCSTCVEYALGIDKPYPANTLVTLPEFELLKDQRISSLKPCDVLHNNGHVFMVFQIKKDNKGLVSKVTLFESSGQKCRIYDTSLESLTSRITKNDIQVYRYRLLDQLKDYTPSIYVNVGTETKVKPKYNDALCPDRGDESVYRTDEHVIINVYNPSYSVLFVEDEDGNRKTFLANQEVDLKELTVGQYKAYVQTGNKVSEPVRFLVTEPKVSVNGSDIHHISFSCDYGRANYCVLCDATGGFLKIQPIDDTCREQGFIDIERIPNNHYYCKVIFDTQYGTVINKPIPVF